MNILLVDDNVYVLEGLLAGIDYPSLGIGQVFTAKSMQEAVELLETEEIPLVLTDIEMPDGSGLQRTRCIPACRQRKKHSTASSG